MLDSLKPCLNSQFKLARKLLGKLNFSKKFKSWKLMRRKARKLSSDLSLLTSSFTAMNMSTQLKHVFKLIDTNGDGKLSTLELKEVLLSLGQEKSKADKEAERIVREMDFDGDGFVDLDEFMTVMENNDRNEESANGVLWENEIVEAFRVFDADGNGLISANELQSVLGRLGCGRKCSIKECRKMIKGVDRDGDGFVDFEEFKVMMSAGC